MRKGVTLLELLIVLFLAGIIMPFLFRMITVTYSVLVEELRVRSVLKEDLDFVLNKQETYLRDEIYSSNMEYYIVSGSVVESMVIMGRE